MLTKPYPTDLYPLSNIHLAEHRTKPANMPDIAYSDWFELKGYQDVQAQFNVYGNVLPDDFQVSVLTGQA